ncbi:MAG: hypothetical protein DWQ02_16635 [Bacteroidetes bacterium]|nr:MAG: hypothetical protein DWQ02_16635 [Bacteroidota bacterium]
MHVDFVFQICLRECLIFLVTENQLFKLSYFLFQKRKTGRIGISDKTKPYPAFHSSSDINLYGIFDISSSFP